MAKVGQNVYNWYYSSMSENTTTPTFNMKVVVRETGLKPDTLRAWERRYGVPAPMRTAGGHRLYSQREIDMLNWLTDRQNEGMSISHAIQLWQQLEDEGVNPLESTADEEVVTESHTTDAALYGNSLQGFRQAWITACLDFNEQEAQYVLAQAFALFPLETVCVELLQHGLSEIGQGWYEGNISVQQEHFASALAVRQLNALLTAQVRQSRRGKIIVACPPYEQHTFSPLLLTLLLRQRGWDVIYLGANVPIVRLEATVNQIAPEMVILVAQTLITAGSLLEMVMSLREMNAPVAYGGGVFNMIEQARTRIPAYFLGKSLIDVPKNVESLIQKMPAYPVVSPPPVEFDPALKHFNQRRSAIETFIHSQLETGIDIPVSELRVANKNLGDNIIAGLQLGDLNMLLPNLEWVQELIINHNSRLPEQTLNYYLSVYKQAALAHLDERGKPVLDWFDQLKV
jgi:DNA-binding transcriptional MerR regulator